jgi:uncharacterized membrane protein YeaQ/YmgE (transglycosylase-associated protein family)
MNKNIVLMVLIGVLLFFLIYNILSGDFFNGIINLIILGVVSSALLKELREQAKTERR